MILLILCPVAPFLSERHATVRDGCCERLNFLQLNEGDFFRQSDRVEGLSKLLLSPTFIFHASWIAALLLTTTIALVDCFLKLVFTGCTVGVAAFAGARWVARSKRTLATDYCILSRFEQRKFLCRVCARAAAGIKGLGGPGKSH